MGNLPRLELTEEKSNLKNNDFIVFRHQSKGKSFKKVSKNVSKKIKNRKKRSHKKRSHKKSRKGFFNLFT